MPQFWAGFVNDKVDTSEVDTGWGGFSRQTVKMPMLFTSRGKARYHYEDVRKVEIRVVSKVKKKK